MYIKSRTEKIQNAPIQKLLDETNVPENTINLGQGTPFFKPPKNVIKTVIKKLKTEKLNNYTPDAGTFDLRETISKKLLKQNNIKADPEKNIIVTSGGNQAFVNAIMAITKPQDEIILLSPYYFNQKMAIQLAECKPVTVPTKENYQPDIKEIFKKYNKKTRAIITVSPNNPTGAVYSKENLKKINDFCQEKEIFHISDEAYENFTYNNKKHVSPASFHKKNKFTISIFSFSKTFGMAGFRVGYMVFPEEIKDEILKIQDTTSICPSTISQVAALEALKNNIDYPEQFLEQIKETRNIFIKNLKENPKIDFPVTYGGFYFLLKLDTNKKSWDISKKLIEKYRVITIPGCVFGSIKPAIRISYGNLTSEDAKKGVERLNKGLLEIL
jgi:aspartate/methionine/tyrosine aminotransferase